MHTHTHLPKHQHTRRRAKQVGRMKEKKSWRTHNGGKHCELYKPFFSLIGVYLGPAARLFVQKIGKYSVFSFTSKILLRTLTHTHANATAEWAREREGTSSTPIPAPREREGEMQQADVERDNRRLLPFSLAHPDSGSWVSWIVGRKVNLYGARHSWKNTATKAMTNGQRKLNEMK